MDSKKARESPVNVDLVDPKSLSVAITLDLHHRHGLVLEARL